MEYQEFEKKVAEALQEKLGSGYQVEESSADRPKGTPKRCIFVRRKGVDVSLVIHMEEYYEKYAGTEEAAALAASRIAAFCEGRVPEKNVGAAGFKRWETVKGNIFGRLINTERNRKLLEEVPHREFLDLSMVYYIRMPDIFEGQRGTAQIFREHMRGWKVEEETLYETAMKNMRDADEAVFESIEGILKQLTDPGPGNVGEVETGLPLFVLGNKERRDGAVQICNQELMERVAGFFKSDFWILPSSIHEVLLLPADRFGEDAEGLAEMVKGVNETQLLPEDVLSDHVYRYCRLTGGIIVVA